MFRFIEFNLAAKLLRIQWEDSREAQVVSRRRHHRQRNVEDETDSGKRDEVNRRQHLIRYEIQIIIQALQEYAWNRYHIYQHQMCEKMNAYVSDGITGVAVAMDEYISSIFVSLFINGNEFQCPSSEREETRDKDGFDESTGDRPSECDHNREIIRMNGYHIMISKSITKLMDLCRTCLLLLHRSQRNFNALQTESDYDIKELLSIHTRIKQIKDNLIELLVISVESPQNSSFRLDVESLLIYMRRC
jgi:hypothetical protein